MKVIGWNKPRRLIPITLNYIRLPSECPALRSIWSLIILLTIMLKCFLLKWNQRNSFVKFFKGKTPTTNRKQYLSALWNTNGETKSKLSLDMRWTQSSKKRCLRVVPHTLNHLSLWVIPHLRRSALLPAMSLRPPQWVHCADKSEKALPRRRRQDFVSWPWRPSGRPEDQPIAFRWVGAEGGCWTIRRLRSCYFWGCQPLRYSAECSKVKTYTFHQWRAVVCVCVCIERETHFAGEQSELFLSSQGWREVYQNGFGEIYPQS